MATKKAAPRKAPARKTAQKTAPATAKAEATSVLVPRASKVPAQDSEFLTTAQGQRLSHTDDSLKAGSRGPTLLEDFHLREKVMHFDHERIPERVVHARGVGVHGVFESYGNATDITCAGFLQPGMRTPVFTRFSTVVGSRGSADTVRDVRGFAVKFYTDEGVFDLVGNNIPVFFIRDGIKFPDLIHAAKPEPDREMPQAQTAHSTFWDFVSLIPESPHMLMWVMSDRAIPRSYRMMEGFGVHTFRLANAAGDTSLVKFHWKPVLGVHGLVWEEAQMLAGVDPDYHRRDLYNAIGAGAFPEWELGVQVMPDTDDQYFEGIDLLDATKLVPEELVPVQPIGRMTLNRNPGNYFAETEQVAFHVGHVVRGIDVTDDPLLQARLFSYLDTQLTRLGGPNFAQIPINRSHAPVNDNHRDGFHQDADHIGRTAYLPNGVGGGCPFLADDDNGGYVHVPRPVDGAKVRERGPDDEYSQATMFWKSMTEVEQDHLVDAFTFELGKCDVQAVVETMLPRLALVDGELARRVGFGLGLVVDTTGVAHEDVDASPSARDDHRRGISDRRPGRTHPRRRRSRPRQYRRTEGRARRRGGCAPGGRHAQGSDHRTGRRTDHGRQVVPHCVGGRARRLRRRPRGRPGGRPGSHRLHPNRLPASQDHRGVGRWPRAAQRGRRGARPARHRQRGRGGAGVRRRGRRGDGQASPLGTARPPSDTRHDRSLRCPTESISFSPTTNG